MIQLIKGSKPKLYLTPRQGFKRTHKDIELELIYAHACPTCANIINAAAKTSGQEIDLYPYEETDILSQGEKNAGDILKKIPNEKDATRSAYEVKHFRGSNPELGGILHLRMKNHIVRPQAVKDLQKHRDNFEEVGERPCFYTGVWSPREDLLVKDLMLLFGFQDVEFDNTYRVPKVAELIPTGGQVMGGEFKLSPTVGTAPPVILVKRNYLRQGQNYYLRSRMNDQFKKSA